jgi:calcium/proton exchanger cax
MSFLKKFKHTFHITIYEACIAIAVIVTYFVLAKAVYHGHPPLWLTISGFVVGGWLAFRPSEWAVSGLDSGSKYVGLSDYVAGILSSLASNLPEAVIAIMLLTSKVGDPATNQLVAVVTVLSAAGFNTLILGIAILIATLKKRGSIGVPSDLEKRESPIIRWAIVALLMTVIFGFVQYAVFGKDNLDMAQLTIPVAAMLAASYIIYLIYLILVKDNTNKMAKHLEDEDLAAAEKAKEEEVHKEKSSHEHERHSIPITLLLLVLGFVGIYFGGETLTENVQHLLGTVPFFATSKGPITAALILGAAGAIPEHSIAIISAAKDEIEVGIGNAMGGILQSALLIFGIIGMIVSITLHPFVLIQLGSIAGTLWFVKRCIHDRRFDTFESLMIIVLQTLVFIILFEDIAILL